MFKLFTTALFLILFTGCTSNDENSEKNMDSKKVLLTFNPEKDKEYLMTYTFSVVNDTTGDETTFTIELVNKIETVADNEISMSSLFQNITMVGKLKGIAVKLIAGDTLKSIPEASLVAAPVFAFHNHTVLFNYTNSFRKTKEKIEEADTIKALQDVESKAQFIAQYPKNKIGVNDTWESDLEIKIGNKKIEKAIFIVKAITDSEVIVDVKGKVNGKGEKFGHEFKMTGDFTGEISIDKKTGWQNKSAMHIQFILEIMGNKTPMKQEISYNLRE